MVVKLVNCQALILLILSVQTFFVNAGNFAPVLLWTSESLNLANPFERTTKVEFENVLNKNLGKERPPVLVFVKNNFCIEDITLNKKNFQVLSKAGPVSYFSAVESPVTAFSDLSSYQVHTSNDLHDFVEGQIYLIDINDISEIPNSEFIQVTRSKNLIVAVTGKSCKLFSPKRSKREVGVETTESSKNLTVKNADVLLYAEEYPMIKVNTDPFKRLGNMINSRFNKTGGKLEIDFDAGENGLQKLTLTFDFKDSAGYYKLDTISVPLTANEKDKAILKVKDVYFPMNSSYHCSRNNVFSNYKKDSPVLLSIKNLQIQIGHEGKFSDDVYSCVGFTSIPIWTGIFVTAILVLILMWGLTMIMDIRTMDRFDDPKGKTIAISAQD